MSDTNDNIYNSNTNNDENKRISLFKSIIKNVIIRNKIVSQIYQVNALLYKEQRAYYRWRDIKNIPHLLCQFGTLNQVKQLIECKLEHKYSKYKWFDDIDLINNSSSNNDDIRYIPGLRGMLKGAIKNNRLEVIEYIYNRYKVFKDEIMYGLVSYALKHGNLYIAKYMVDHYDPKWPLSSESYDVTNMNTHGRAELTEYYIDLDLKYNGKLTNIESLSNCASLNGHIHILQKLYELGYKPKEMDMKSGARGGHLVVVQFVHEKKDSDWDYWRCIAEAIRNNNNEVAKYLVNVRSKDQPLDKWVIQHAAVFGNLEMIQFLLENGHSIFQEDTVLAAAGDGRLEVVKYLFQHYTDKCIAADPMRKAIYYNHFNVIKYIHENYPQSVTGKYLLFDGSVRPDYSVLVYCLENKLAYYKPNILTQFIDSKLWMYINQHSNETLQYSSNLAIRVSLNYNDMEMIQYVIKRSKGEWNWIREMFQLNCTDKSMIQALLEQVPIQYKEEWDFTKEFEFAVDLNHPITTIQYIIDNFKFDINKIVPIISLSAHNRNMDLFVHLLKIYESHINSDGYTQIIHNDRSLDSNGEPIITKYIFQQYDDGRLNYKDIVQNTLKKKIEKFRYIKKILLDSGKFNPNLIEYNNMGIRNLLPPIFKYILKYVADFTFADEFMKIYKHSDECVYVPYLLIPMYNYYKRVGARDKPHLHSEQNMDIVRFIHFNASPSFGYKREMLNPSSIKCLLVFFKNRSLLS